MKSGNGIPARCVYLEEMAADLDEQDWLDMDNIEQVGLPTPGIPLAVGMGTEFISSQKACWLKLSMELPAVAPLEAAMGVLG